VVGIELVADKLIGCGASDQFGAQGDHIHVIIEVRHGHLTGCVAV
jgi:hypothetical protein